MLVELIYDADCPNITTARTNLLRAFAEAGVPAKWDEWERHSPDSPHHVRNFASPTILVDGRDVADPGESSCDGSGACRVYSGDHGELTGAPSVTVIVQALSQAEGSPPPSPPRKLAAIGPAVGGAVLAKLACPVCWPAAAALLASAGVSLPVWGTWMPLVAGTLLLASLGVIAFEAHRRRSTLTLLVGVLGLATILAGWQVIGSDAVLVAGVVLMAAATLVFPRRRQECPTCLPIPKKET
ncbi:MAG: hypothetical protein HY985_02605 [Magnetospirillum sp.]|nr:hypothetical protein [Magnetospirillum sp.]